jgi:cyclophilin family peptidyl-prolyl cis-trans isomerase
MCALGIIAMASSCGNSGQKQNKEKDKTMTFDATVLSEEPVLDIKTDLGTIKVKLYKETPLHRDNFVKLASEGYYDGLLFHRVIDGFMIQAGDPLTKDPSKSAQYGTGGPGYTIPAEIIPGLTHKKGALAAARRGDAANPKRESSGSQFYIVQEPQTCAQLDGQYTVFGETISGFDVIDRIAAVETDGRDKPVKDIHIISIRPEKSAGAQEAAAE